jgi:hypothetical protein
LKNLPNRLVSRTDCSGNPARRFVTSVQSSQEALMLRAAQPKTARRDDAGIHHTASSSVARSKQQVYPMEKRQFCHYQFDEFEGTAKNNDELSHKIFLCVNKFGKIDSFV